MVYYCQAELSRCHPSEDIPEDPSRPFKKCSGTPARIKEFNQTFIKKMPSYDNSQERKKARHKFVFKGNVDHDLNIIIFFAFLLSPFLPFSLSPLHPSAFCPLPSAFL